MITFIKQSWKLVVWLVVAGVLMTLIMSYDRGWSATLQFKVASFTCLIWVFLWLGNAYLSNWIDEKITWQEKPVSRLLAGIIGMLVYTVSIVYVLVFVYRRAFDLIVTDDMRGFLYVSVTITTIISMFMTSRSFLLNWRQSAIDAEALKRESIKAQYNSLKNQVNPHFLFNSLNALTNLVYQDQDQAVKFIKQLSEVYRYVLDTRDKEVVPVQEELKFLNSFVFLQQIRFGNKLKLSVNLEEVTGYVAPLALQMLVENAIKHNEISEENPLSIRIYSAANRLVVENSMLRKSILPEESSGLGLDNIRRRYEFLTDHKVMIEESHGQFKVGLPLITK